MTLVLNFSCLLCVFILLKGQEAITIENNCTSWNTPSNFKNKTNSAAAITKIPTNITEKWKVKRISRKQYEMIDVLERKTKTFKPRSTSDNISTLSKYRSPFSKNSQYNTLSPHKLIKKTFQTTHLQLNNRPKIPSYIEFSYLDYFDERVRRKDLMPRKSSTTLISDEYKLALFHPPVFLFKINEAPENKYIHKKYTTKSRNKINMKNETDTGENKNTFILKERFTTLLPKTSYDRIKFFEIYDSDTHKPRIFIDNKLNIVNNHSTLIKGNIHLDEIDHNTDNHNGAGKMRHVKKHVNLENNDSKNPNLNPQFKSIRHNISSIMKMKGKILTKHSLPALWSEFPYTAVYVYEPMQVRCDSAAISPHWLVATATCLYRHHRNLKTNTEGRSAFVTYCGSDWRLPGRIAYVKRSFIHPRFQARNKSRRYLYNIGVIQVLNSMANTCNGWRPVSLMSHQFVADRDGSYAAAVGWGLDRYDPRYGSTDITTHPLMLYEGIVYSNSCPGNDYSKVTELDEESIKNVYCLSLPTSYLGENDTIHGGLLLIGGKLIALYVQEERRQWGIYSALYTGIWRLIPWLLDVAREVEELDTVLLDV